MLDHVSLGVAEIERSRRFYDAVLRPLGIVRIVDFGNGRGSDYGAIAGQLGVEFTITLEPSVAPAPGMHLCFRAPLFLTRRASNRICVPRSPVAIDDLIIDGAIKIGHRASPG